jgi:hypothetical protein
MRKALVARAVATLGLMIFWSVAGPAQEVQSKPAAEAKAAAKSSDKGPEVHAYRLDFSLNELEGGKKVNTRQYALYLNSDDSNELKVGTKVPVDVNKGQFEYIDVGTNIWARIGEHGDGVALSVRAENSNFAAPNPDSTPGRPEIRQLQIKASTVAQLGKPMVIGSVDDTNSKRQFQLEVTVTKLLAVTSDRRSVVSDQ